MLYLLTAAPSITWRNGGIDSGDLATAAATGSVAHPPGYPTYLPLARLATLLPVEPARALALLSAGSGALAVAGIAAAARRGALAAAPSSPQAAPLASAAVAAAAAAAPLLWANSTFAEVNAPATALAALWVGAGLWQPRGPLQCGLAGLFLGLATGIHPLLAGLAVLTAMGACAAMDGWSRRLAGTGALLLGLVAGGCVYVTLAWYPPAGPVNWFRPQTWDGWRALVQAEAYRSLAVPGFLLPRLLQMGRQLAVSLGIVGAIAALAALLDVPALRRTGALLAVLLPAALAPLYVLFAALYLARDSEVYVLPAVALLAPAAGAGTAGLLRALGGRTAANRSSDPVRASLLLVLALLPAAVELVVNYRRLDLHADRTAVRFAQETLDRAPPGAILLASGDEATFSLWYARYALGRRPDVSVVNDDLLARGWYRAQLARMGVPLPVRDGEVTVDSAGALAAAASRAGVPLVLVRAPDPAEQP